MLNRLLAFLVCLISVVACSSEKNSEQKDAKAQFYGAQITMTNSTPIGQLEQLMEGQDSISVKLEGYIEKTCANKGCWMTVQDETGKPVRVTFKDYGFFVPKSGVEGKKVIFEGLAIKTVTPVEELRHYAEDGGASPEEIEQIKSPKEEFKFIANGVAIL